MIRVAPPAGRSRTNFMPRTLTEDSDVLHLVLNEAAALPGGAHDGALGRALARGEREPTAADHGAVLLARAGLAPEAGSAALERLGLGLDASGVWCSAALVHLMPTLDSLRLLPLDAAALPAGERQ